MPSTTLATPTTAGAAGDFARALVRLKASDQAPDASLAAADALALGDALAAEQSAQQSAVAQAFPDTATVCLPEWETTLGLPVRSDLSNVARQAICTAKVRAARGGSPSAIKRALDTLATTPVRIAETAAPSLLPADARLAFRFSIVLSAADYADTDLQAAMAALIEAMKPAHTTYRFVEGPVLLYTDAPTSGYELGVLGS